MKGSRSRSGAKLELSDIMDTSYLQAMLDTFSDDMLQLHRIQIASAFLMIAGVMMLGVGHRRR